MELLVSVLVELRGPFVPAATADLGVCTEACQKQAYLLGASQHKDPFRYSQRVKSSLYTSWKRNRPLLFKKINWRQVVCLAARNAPKQRVLYSGPFCYVWYIVRKVTDILCLPVYYKWTHKYCYGSMKDIESWTSVFVLIIQFPLFFLFLKIL